MKKIIFTMLSLALTLTMSAQSQGLFARKAIKSTNQDQSVYAQRGAVPEVDGKVVFHEVIATPGKSKKDIVEAIAQWISFRYEKNSTNGQYTDADFFKNLEFAEVKRADKSIGVFEAQGAEELVFSIKPLAKNFTEVFYLLDLVANEGQVDFTLHNISFNVDKGAGEMERANAEEWITDAECLNKKGEMRRVPSKFRIKTIDLVTELKAEIVAAINQ